MASRTRHASGIVSDTSTFEMSSLVLGQESSSQVRPRRWRKYWERRVRGRSSILNCCERERHKG